LWKSTTSFVGTTASTALLGAAMAGVGLKTNMAVLKGVGMAPFACGFLGASIVAGAGFTASYLFV
jgi:uncharacterized membrane protein YadS